MHIKSRRDFIRIISSVRAGFESKVSRGIGMLLGKLRYRALRQF
jgi:hypothetical protein